MKILARVFNKIFDGFLYGIGFCVILICTTYAMQTMFYGSIVSSTNDIPSGCSQYEDCPEESGLSLTITSEKINNDDFVLLGNVLNESEHGWNSVKIKAEILDAEGNFIDECSERLDQKLAAGSRVNFKLSCTTCTSCAAVDLDNYDSYSASIISAHNW